MTVAELKVVVNSIDKCYDNLPVSGIEFKTDEEVRIRLVQNKAPQRFIKIEGKVSCEDLDIPVMCVDETFYYM